MHIKAEKHAIKRIMEDNDHLALANREFFDKNSIFAANFMSAPGAGKTAFIIELLSRLPEEPSFVIEGDMVGELDAKRLEAKGIAACQITTGKSCHLDASMIARVLRSEKLGQAKLLFIENVGNLVCPAEFPLGAHLRIVLLSVTEGDDKPMKYPVIFNNCNAVVLTKTDLLPYVDFDVQKVRDHLNGINPEARIFQVSTKQDTSGQPNEIDYFVQWLQSMLLAKRNA